MTNFLYNPDRKSKEQLIAEFVVRTDLLRDIMDDLESSSMKTPEQHYLLVGQRGTGKTTLLNRIKYAIEDSKKLKNWLIPVIFNEEQYNISELANLWESVAHILEDYYGFSGITSEMEQFITKENFEELCYEILEKRLKEKDKKLVLLIDNVGDLLKKLEDVEVRRLREILQTKPHIRLIAGSPFYLDSILDYKQPFFEFFKIKRLDGLNKVEAEQLLLKLGEVFNEKEKIERIIKETPERIETLRVLTGGVPRTIALMFRIFIDHEHESSLKDLERILDAVTPLYKHRMDDLPKQQQKIVDAVARKWDAISVKEIREKVRLESKIISAQLRQLEKNQIIEKRETDTKNHLYLLKERFWNIWYLMRYGRKTDNERVVWLVRFLESWYDPKEFDEKITSFAEGIFFNKSNDDVIEFFGKVYSSMTNLPQMASNKLALAVKKWESREEDKQHSVEINQKLKDHNYLGVFDKACQLSFISDEHKLVLMQLISFMHDEKVNSNIKQDVINKILGFSKDDTHLGRIFCVFLLLAYGTIMHLPDNSELSSNEFMILCELLINLLNNFGDDFLIKIFKIEYLLFETVLIHHLNEGHTELIKKAFETPEYNKIRQVFEPMYFAVLATKDKKILDTLGEEMQNAVNLILQKVEKFKDRLTEMRNK